MNSPEETLRRYMAEAQLPIQGIRAYLATVPTTSGGNSTADMLENICPPTDPDPDIDDWEGAPSHEVNWEGGSIYAWG